MARLTHYTDSVGLKSILEKTQLWLTDARFLNDHTEFRHGLDFLLDAIENRAEDLKGYGFDSEHIKAYLTNIAEIGKDYSVSLISFSGQEDLLSQWRGYCPLEGGYAIVLNGSSLASDDTNMDLSPCLYGYEEKRQTALTLCDELIQIMQVEDLSGRQQVIESKNQTLSVARKVWKVLASFKHESYAEEREVRLLAFSKRNEYQHRTMGSVIKPYFAYSLLPEAIERIWIGPMRNQELALEGLNSLLDALYGAPGRLTLRPQVMKSEIPYRVL
jgi:hypothetical protein